jgi:hypothetical protein
MAVAAIALGRSISAAMNKASKCLDRGTSAACTTTTALA